MTPTKVDSVSPYDIAKMHLTNITGIRSCNTAYPSDEQKNFDYLKLHRIFGCCRFHNSKHTTSANNNATLISIAKLPTTLSSSGTIPKAN